MIIGGSDWWFQLRRLAHGEGGDMSDKKMRAFRCKKTVATVDCMGRCFKTLEEVIAADTKKRARELFKRRTGVFPASVEEIS